MGGDAARYFDPHDVEAMAETIRVVWTDSDMRAEMRQLGLEQAARFSWKRAAEETLAIYERLLGKPSPTQIPKSEI
jgi:glycosyltransferase involved in cell wall biosynthesis